MDTLAWGWLLAVVSKDSADEPFIAPIAAALLHRAPVTPALPSTHLACRGLKKTPLTPDCSSSLPISAQSLQSKLSRND